MRKFLNYFLSFFTIAALLFAVSCTEDGEGPIEDLIINLDPSDSTSAAPGDTVSIYVDVTGAGDDTQLQVLSDLGGTFIPSNGMVAPGDSVQFIVPADAQLGETYTLTFSIVDSNISEQFAVNIAYDNVGAVIASQDNLSILNQALSTAGLEGALADENASYTIFAPDNTAFGGVDLTGFTEEQLTSLLQYHVISTDVLTSAELQTGMYQTLNGDSVSIVVDGTNIAVNGVSVITADLVAGNGVVHIVDGIIMPDVTTYEAFLLAAPTDDQESETFFSSRTGELYSYNGVINTSENVSETIDFGYFYGVTNGATIASPDSYPDNIYGGLAAWNTLNNTDFRMTNLTVDDFDAIEVGQGDMIEGHFETGTDFANTGRANELANNDIVAFTTGDGRFGLIKVVEVVGTIGAADGIRIEVKVTN